MQKKKRGKKSPSATNKNVTTAEPVKCKEDRVGGIGELCIGLLGNCR